MLRMTIEQWVRRLNPSYGSYDGDTSDVLSLHEDLHRQYGAAPNEALLPGEQRLSAWMAQYGIPHRQQDELAKAAGTLVADLPPPDVYEVSLYLPRALRLHPGAVQLLQKAEEEGGKVYLYVSTAVLPGADALVLRAINRSLPKDLQLGMAPAAPEGDFVVVKDIFDLELSYSIGSTRVLLWKALQATMQQEAAAASSVFKDSKNLELNTRVVLKAAPAAADDPLFVLNIVLEPETPDKTKTDKTDGDIYSAEEIEKACHWWAENSRRFALGHVMKGGAPLGDDSIRMVENYIQRSDTVLDGTPIKAGTWLTGALVYDPVLKDGVLSGAVNAWSIGARMEYELEEHDEDESDSESEEASA